MKLSTRIGAGLLLSVLGLAFLSRSLRAEDLKVGSAAPDFTAPASDGSRVHLSEWLNRAPIVLYFYPKDDTPGCTKEACNIRDNFTGFRDLKATVFGISYDSISSHKKFVQKYHLPFLLLTDLDHSIAKSYGAGGLLTASRQTFVINKNGTIVYLNRFVEPANHSLELQNVLAQL
jgi:peroxiredoxin Q/BCP